MRCSSFRLGQRTVNVSRADILIFNEDDTRFRVDRSKVPGAGHGLFASEALAPGTRLEVIGPLIRADTPSDRCTSYADQYKFRVGDFLLIPLGHAAMVNSSETPNMRKVIEDGRVYLEALRPIESGEELFFSYDCGLPAGRPRADPSGE